MFAGQTSARITALLATAAAATLTGCGAEAPDSRIDSTAATAQPVVTLANAVRNGELETARELIGQGVDLNAADVDGSTLLIQAAGSRNAELAALLIEAGADVDAVNRYGMSALHLAARNADATTVKALLGAGADSSITLPEGESILMAAAKSGNPEVISALLARGVSANNSGEYGSASVALNAADPNLKEGWYGQTALMWAAAAGHVDAMKLLIEAGADVDAASSRMAVPEVSKDRMQGGFVYPKIPKGRLTALHFAARQGHLGAVQTLIDAGADLDIGDEHGSNALVLATLNGHLDVTAALLEAGADPNVADEYGRTVLFVATDLNTLDVNPRPAPPIRGDHSPTDIAKLALAKGAEPDLALTDMGLPAWVAQGGGHNPMLGEGATALFRAAMSGDLEIMTALLEAGADPLIVTSEIPCKMDADACEYTNMLRPNGKATPFMAAAGLGWRYEVSRGRDADAIKAMEMLLDLGADINQKDQAGNTALHGAAYRQSAAIAEFLVANGADVTATNERGWTALDIAMGQPDFRIAAHEATAAALQD